MKVQISTVEKTIYNSTEVKSVTLPTKSGEITVLARHIPLVSLLRSGVLKLELHSGKEEFIAVSGGVLEVRDDTDREKKTEVIILADSADLGREIDQARVETARELARQALEQPAKLSEEEYRQLLDSLEADEARLKAAVRYKNTS